LSAINFSDHRPVSLSLNLGLVCPPVNENVNRRAKVFKVRWDKGDLVDYYRTSGNLLQSQPLICINKIADSVFDMALNSYYSSIVNQLCRSEQLTIPRIPYAALKPFWNDQLDDLKHDSIFWYNVWVSADKPNSGTLFQIKKNTKYKYKLAVRQAFANMNINMMMNCINIF
jgi:hypothetical protein